MSEVGRSQENSGFDGLEGLPAMSPHERKDKPGLGLRLKDILHRPKILVPILCPAYAPSALVTAPAGRKAALMRIRRAIASLVKFRAPSRDDELMPPPAKKSGRARATNRPWPNSHTPGGSVWARRFRDLCHELAQDQPFAESPPARQHAIKRCAATILSCERLEEEMARGERVNLDTYRQLVSTCARLLRALEGKPPPHSDVAIDVEVAAFDAYLMSEHGATRSLTDQTHVPQAERGPKSRAIMRHERERAIREA